MSDLDVKMHFTYDAYGGLVETLLTNGYKIATYDNWNNIDKPVILRHDIDTSIEKAVEMAAFENKIGVTSTYFVLLTSDFYNICSRKSQEGLANILKYGHNIGLHFDETVYEIAGEKSQYDLGNIVSKIKDEAFILGNVLNYPINSVSYHRPSKAVLDADLEIPGMINSYGHMFFSGLSIYQIRDADGENQC